MLYAPPIDRPPALHGVASFLAATRNEYAAPDDRFDVMRQVIPSPLKVGDTTYLLRSQIEGTYYPGPRETDGDFVVSEFFPDFVGRGRGLNEAFLDWRDRVHSRFQDLYSKRPFEMTASDKAIWQILESQIDVNAYRTTTPLTVRQIGKVSPRVRPLPEVIEWEDGHKEKVRLDQMPGEFAAYRPGQVFEAIVARDPADFRLLKVTHIHRIRSLPCMTPEQFGDMISSIPTTRALPDADWE